MHLGKPSNVEEYIKLPRWTPCCTCTVGSISAHLDGCLDMDFTLNALRADHAHWDLHMGHWLWLVIGTIRGGAYWISLFLAHTTSLTCIWNLERLQVESTDFFTRALTLLFISQVKFHPGFNFIELLRHPLSRIPVTNTIKLMAFWMVTISCLKQS